jgi:hypothetical protein
VFTVGTVGSLSRRECFKCGDLNALHKMGRCVNCGTLAKTPKFRIDETDDSPMVENSRARVVSVGDALINGVFDRD